MEIIKTKYFKWVFRRNPENECFCMKEEGFTCFKSGVYDIGPCRKTPGRPFGAPIALSAPHFYQADPSFREAVVGMKPEKEMHQSYVDVVPELGIPLAIQTRFVDCWQEIYSAKHSFCSFTGSN